MADDAEAVRDAAESAYQSRAIFPPHVMASTRAANAQFLDLVADRARDGAAEAYGLAPEYAARLREMGAEGRRDIADCPFTLFNMRFEDVAYWRAIQRRCAEPAASSPVESVPAARTAAFLAWYLAGYEDRAAASVLGMPPSVQRVWRGIAVSSVELAAATALPEMRARWPRQLSFWPSLLDSLGPDQRARAEIVRLLGMQLIAADARWPRTEPLPVR